MKRLDRYLALVVVLATAVSRSAEPPLSGTAPLTGEADLSLEMVRGMSRYLEGETARAAAARQERWHPDQSDPRAYEKSVEPNRARLARIIGAIDPRVPAPEMELVGTIDEPAKVAETDRFIAYAVRWPVFEGGQGEGLLLQPKTAVQARLVALPDADQTPEAIAGLTSALPPEAQFARRLAENGVQVVIPTLVDRSDTFSGSTIANRWTNEPGREWIYRQAYPMGRHIIGYEVQKVMAAVDWLSRQSPTLKIGVAGWGEGGLLALYSAALDRRIEAALVSGYFGPRERLNEEPIYRNLFGLLREFGDAEMAQLIVPRILIVDAAVGPSVEGPPAVREGRRNAAAPGRIRPVTGEAARAETDRARALAGPFAAAIRLHEGSSPTKMISTVAVQELLSVLAPGHALQGSGSAPVDQRTNFRPSDRQERAVRELERFTQRVCQLAANDRTQSFWNTLPISTPEAWQASTRTMREKFATELIGRLPEGQVAPRPRSRFVRETAAWTAYEVVLDVRPGVFAWGYLLLPKGMRPDEKRPVIVAQHGLNSTHVDVIDENPESKYYHQFKGVGARLAERGFIVFAPRNPYGGDDVFRGIQRQANPLGLSIFSFIVEQHATILDWLCTQPNVDPARIGFYGLSYGGKTAMRVPAILGRYAVSVCSGDFNEWLWKLTATDSDHSYVFTNEYELPEFNLGATFNYAEMAALIAPRPFMVERGHDDTVSIDEWVAFEYAKVNRLYAKLGIPERTAIEYFVGPHTIHGVGTFRFLHRTLQWPEPAP